ncbi:helix-turn-helix domain-containing protein [Candidatus Enterococcus ikei]|uniref:Helix-turn-helix domain-containing protein n=1 Tax=Candidatus Enterococcus ikei TaxID=2815326 RepID=A0ABS3GZI5_9ENTE|nr:helix-turn-helix domain-containing protein [Enterococcus sp. DIV0869a]MBO0440333.1 helix-turn-helix domain-containing protein [Enterococcus sp. DIV0869a]
MQNSFMGKKERMKFELFKSIAFAKYGMSFNDLMQKHELTKSTLSRYINDLAQDVELAFEEKAHLNQDSQTGTYQVKAAEAYSIGYLIDYIHLFYVEQSGSFFILDALLKKRYTSIEAMAQDLHMSSSSVYKQLRLLKKMLAPFGGKITFDQHSSSLNGDELGIRLFTFYAYWSVFKSTEYIPFFNTNYPEEWLELKEIEDYFDHATSLSESQRAKLRFMQLITLKRVLWQKNYIKVSEEFLADVAYFDNKDAELLPLLKHRLTDELYHNERALLLYATRGLIYNLDSLETKRKIVQDYQQSSLEIAEYTTKLMAEVQKEFELEYTEESYINFYFYLIILLIYIKHINMDISGYYKNGLSFHSIIDYDEASVETFEKINKIIEQQEFYSKISKEYLEGVMSIFSLTIYSGIYLSKKAGSVSICVIFNNNLILADGIKKIILDVYNKDRIVFTNDVMTADLVISDSYEVINPQTEYFYFDEQLNPEQWEKMIDTINQIFYKTIFLGE